MLEVRQSPLEYQENLVRIFSNIYENQRDEWSRDESILQCGERAMREVMRIHENSLISALDIGCGDGRLGGKIAQLGHHCLGIDFVQNQNWSVLKNKYPEALNFCSEDFFAWKEPENKFNFIHDGGCFHHQHESFWPQWFEKIKRILAPRGIYSTIVWGEQVYQGNKDADGRLHHVFVGDELDIMLAAQGLRVVSKSLIPSRKGPIQVHILSTPA